MHTIRPNSIFWTSRLLAAILFFGMAIGCASSPTAMGDLTSLGRKSPTIFAESSSNWPLDPLSAEDLMRSAPMQIVSESYAGAGISGARRIEAHYQGKEQPLTLKWKTMPHTLDGINNSPRREIASYRAQFFFLDPVDFMVPPSVARCLAPGAFAEPDSHRSLVRRKMNCELGILSLWLRDVEIPNPLYDETRFLSDPTYARQLANFNLLTYLIRHRDGRDGNFLSSKDSFRPITFAIDNGMTFGGFFYNWFVDNWDEIEVPALPRESIDRLRGVTKRDIEKLGIIAELHLDTNGIYRSVAHGKNLDRDDGVRTKAGIIQLGLTDDEIEDVWERIKDLLEDVDGGKIPLF